MRNIDRLLTEYDMLPPDGLVLCAVSGGADSMCLLHELNRRGVSVVAAHYNHSLRGAQSDDDAAFVARQCGAWSIPVLLGTGEVAAAAAARKRGVEETARAMRYAFLEQTADEIGAGRIATAHTADDNVETILLNLTRGCGLRGLSGIPPRRGRLIRPLLETSRAAVEAYVAAHNIPFCTDESNTDARYARNRIRHQVVPVLRGINPALTGGVLQTARTLRQEDALLDELAAGYSLANAPDALALRRAAQLLREQGQAQYARAHLRAVARLFRESAPSGAVRLPGGMTALREYDGLTLVKELPETPPPVPLPSSGTVAFGRWHITVRAGICPTENLPDTFWLDCGKIESGLLVRTRAAGDTLCLPGRRRRTLKKLFIDARIPRHVRAGIPVLADGRRVAAVGGFGADAAYRAAPGSRALCIIITEDGEG